VAATARRVLTQLRGDRHTVGMLLVVPSGLLALIHEMLDSAHSFDQLGPLLLGIFPFTLMFLITSVAMLRERTSGTLERLLTTPMSKLDLLLGYGVAFAVAATAQALVTATVAYGLLGLYTPGGALALNAVAVAGAVLGMALGLLVSAFATSEFQAVQFMPALVMPQILLGGLFVPREQMADWLQRVSDALPLTYVIEALREVRRTSLVTPALVGYTAVVLGIAALALVLAASTLRRRPGELGGPARRAARAVPVAVVVLGVAVTVGYLVDAHRFVRTDNAQIDGDRIPITAPATGTLLDWRAAQGATLRRHQILGRIEGLGGFPASRQPLRAPQDGTVALAGVVEGAYVTAGTELAVAYDLSRVYVTARVDETDIGAVHPGGQVDVRVDGYPHATLTGYVQEIQGGTSDTFSTADPGNTTGSFDRFTRVIPVKIAITNGANLTLVPGMSVTVAIRKDP
jgi:ABC-2 type transport system permease protein